MSVNNPKPTSATDLNNKKQNDFQWNAQAYRVIQIDDSGSTASQLVTSKFSINNLDDDGNDANANYYGFEASDGSWYIMKEDKSSNPVVYTYSTGSSGYSTAWTNRASQSYDTFGNTF